LKHIIVVLRENRATALSCNTGKESLMAWLRNITSAVDEDVARWARIEAAKEDSSVSRLVGEMLRERITRGELRKSDQASEVLRECYVQLLRIWPERRAEAQAEVRDLLASKPVALHVAILELSWKLEHRYQLSFWDALKVAAAKATGPGYLLPEDLPAGLEFDGVKVLNPFLTEPAALGGW
jgi:predicted nucleic acid-binding protein